MASDSCIVASQECPLLQRSFLVIQMISPSPAFAVSSCMKRMIKSRKKLCIICDLWFFSRFCKLSGSPTILAVSAVWCAMNVWMAYPSLWIWRTIFTVSKTTTRENAELCRAKGKRGTPGSDHEEGLTAAKGDRIQDQVHLRTGSQAI